MRSQNNQKKEYKANKNPNGQEVFITTHVLDEEYEINVRQKWILKNIVTGYINNGYFRDDIKIDDINVYDYKSDKSLSINASIQQIAKQLGVAYDDLTISILDKLDDPHVLKRDNTQQQKNIEKNNPIFADNYLQQSSYSQPIRQQYLKMREKSRHLSSQLLAQSLIDEQQTQQSNPDKTTQKLIYLWGNKEQNTKQIEQQILSQFPNKLRKSVSIIFDHTKMLSECCNEINKKLKQFYQNYKKECKIKNISSFTVDNLQQNFITVFKQYQQVLTDYQAFKDKYSGLDVSKTLEKQKYVLGSNLSLRKTVKRDQSLLKDKQLQTTKDQTQQLSIYFQKPNDQKSQMLSKLKKIQQQNQSLSIKVQSYILSSTFINNNNRPIQQQNLLRQLRNITRMKIQKLNIQMTVKNHTEQFKFEQFSKNLRLIPEQSNCNLLIIFNIICQKQAQNHHTLAIFSQNGISYQKKKLSKEQKIKKKCYIINLDDSRQIYEYEAQMKLIMTKLELCGPQIAIGFKQKYNLGLNVKQGPLKELLKSDWYLIDNLQLYNVQLAPPSQQIISGF